MAGIPPWLLRQAGQTVTIEPLAGEGATGPVYTAGVPVRVLIDATRRLVRDGTGQQVVSEATIYAQLGTECPVGSRVTLPDGRATAALTVATIDGGTLPVPSHLEIALQ